MRSVLLKLVTMLLVSFPVAANACTCVYDPNPKFPTDDLIFLGTVTSMQLGAYPDSPYPGRYFTVRFSITEGLKGTQRSEVEVLTPEQSSTCGYPFQTGFSYLVFAHQEEGRFFTSHCSATRPGVVAAALIHQLRAIREGHIPAPLFGFVGRHPVERRIEDQVKIEPAEGIEVKAVGPDAEFTTRTDKDGAYEFNSLPFGDYHIVPVLPAKFSAPDMELKNVVKVEPGVSRQNDVSVFWDGKVSGHVVDREKRPLAGVISLVPADPDEEQTAYRTGGWASAEIADGGFDLAQIAPGRYRLRFSPNLGRGVSFRYKFYYPGTMTKEQSTIIEIGEGQHVENLVLVVPLLPKAP